MSGYLEEVYTKLDDMKCKQILIFLGTMGNSPWGGSIALLINLYTPAARSGDLTYTIFRKSHAQIFELLSGQPHAIGIAYIIISQTFRARHPNLSTCYTHAQCSPALVTRIMQPCFRY